MSRIWVIIEGNKVLILGCGQNKSRVIFTLRHEDAGLHAIIRRKL